MERSLVRKKHHRAHSTTTRLEFTSAAAVEFPEEMGNRVHPVQYLKGPRGQATEPPRIAPTTPPPFFLMSPRFLPLLPAWFDEGNKDADDDIAAFYRAKEELERRKSVGRSRAHG